jgi:hypothetical protein
MNFITRRMTLLTLLSGLAGWLVLSAAPSHAWAATTGSGQQVTQTREVTDFNRVSLAGDMKVLISQSRQGSQAGSYSVQVRADDNLQALLETVVDDGRLQIRWKRGETVYRAGRVVVTVVMPALTALAVAGSGDLELAPFTTPSLKVAVAGSGDAQLTGLATEDLSVSVSGGGDVRGAGKSARVTVSVAGSGDVRLQEMKAGDVSVSIAGSGDVAVHADKTLKVSIAGSGDVVYSGQAVVTRRVAGSGSVTQR